VDIDCRGVVPNEGENVSYSRWYMGETFMWNNCVTIEEHGKPKVERVVCNNDHQNQSLSGEGKISSGAAEIPLNDRIAPPHSLHNPRSESF